MLVFALGCSSSVVSGYPRLVTGCDGGADCAVAGPEFVCNAGACQIQACVCDDQCPAALACFFPPGNTVGECLVTTPTRPCPAGTPDAGQ